MTDNSNTTWATDDVAGIHYPRLKIEFGADGTATDISYSKPMPANAAFRGDALIFRSVSVAPSRAIISCSSSTTATVVAAKASVRMQVLDYTLITRATTSVEFRSSTTRLTGTMTFDKSGGATPGFNPFGHFATDVGQPLIIAAGDGAVAGNLVYVEVTATPILVTFNDPGGHIIANGTSVAGATAIEAIPTGGFPPYTFDWSDNMANVFLTASTSSRVRYLATGTDTEHIGALGLRVTDSAGQVVSTSTTLDIIQGNPP